MTAEAWTGLIGITGVVCTALFKFLKWLIPWLKRQSGKRDVVKGIQQLHLLYLAMSEALDDESGAHRVILFTAHNTGGVPRANAPFYASALHWAIDGQWANQYARKEEKVSDYTHLSVDADYIGMLCELMANKEYHYSAHTHDPNSMLAEIYSQSGVTDSYIVLLGFYDNKMFYVSFARYEDKLTTSQKTILFLKANRMKRILDAP